MNYSVPEFVSVHRAEIENMRGYKALLEDLSDNSRKRSFNIKNAILAKKLLSNDYGHVCDSRLCMAFKKFVTHKQESVARRTDGSSPVTV